MFKVGGSLFPVTRSPIIPNSAINVRHKQIDNPILVNIGERPAHSINRLNIERQSVNRVRLGIVKRLKPVRIPRRLYKLRIPCAAFVQKHRASALRRLHDKIEAPVFVQVNHRRHRRTVKRPARSVIAGNWRGKQLRILIPDNSPLHLLVWLEVNLVQFSVRPHNSTRQRLVDHQRVCASREFFGEGIAVAVSVAFLCDCCVAVPV